MPEKIDRSLLSGREYIGVDKIDGPLVFISKTHPVGYRELIECVDGQGHVRLGNPMAKPQSCGTPCPWGPRRDP